MIENSYQKIIALMSKCTKSLIPYFRRLIRFIALPHYFINGINWEECNRPKIYVIYDILFIFFKLKYYPDNYSLCRLWEKNKDEWKYYYGSIYNPFPRKKLRKIVQPSEYEIIFQDKFITNEMCKSFDLPVPLSYGVIDNSISAKKLLKTIFNEKPDKKLIIKPLRGKGGKGILLAYLEKGQIVVQKKDKKVNGKNFNFTDKSIVQEFLNQHKDLSVFSSSLNTLRIVTFLSEDKTCMIVGASIRFGVGDAYVDNMSSGGIGVGIDLEEGTMKEFAYDFKSKKYAMHPDSKITFMGYKIPFWKEVLSLSEKIQKRFFFYKLIGIDIAITPSGPVIIELNEATDMVWTEQSFGPILKDKNVWKNFRSSDLLINRYQKSLHNKDAL